MIDWSSFIKFTGLFFSGFLSSKFDPEQIHLIIPIKVTSEDIVRRHGRVDNTSCNQDFLRVCLIHSWTLSPVHINRFLRFSGTYISLVRSAAPDSRPPSI